MITKEGIKEAVLTIISKYPIKRVSFFGSRAAETNQENSIMSIQDFMKN